VLHHFFGTWKAQKGFPGNGIFGRVRKWFAPEESKPLVQPARIIHDPLEAIYPVSINHAGTVFTMMVNSIEHGDLQSHEDVSAALTRFGNWQAGMDNTLQPRAPVALVGALGKIPAADGKPILLDIGAGLGFYAITAAVRGHKVVAIELAPKSLRAFRESLRVNQLDGLVTIVDNTTLGLDPQLACVQPKGGNVWPHTWRSEDIARGFAAPEIHERTDDSQCERRVQRVPMQMVVAPEEKVGAVRVSAGAWTGEILKGGLPFLRKQKPHVILVEVDMVEMSRIKSFDFLQVVRSLHEMGYQNMAHAGNVCVQRFQLMVGELQKAASQAALQTDVNDLRQPAWCDVDISNVEFILEQNRRNGLQKQDRMNAAGVELFLLQLNVTAESR
jgi:hypothetical protein